MALRLGALALASLALACGSTPAAEPAPATTGAETTSTTDEPSTAPEPAAEALSPIPECDAYLRLYQRCEPALAASIAGGDRRDFTHERGWIEYLASTPEVAGLPTSCATMHRELQSVCP